jgi:hypothetical protein
VFRKWLRRIGKIEERRQMRVEAFYWDVIVYQCHCYLPIQYDFMCDDTGCSVW